MHMWGMTVFLSETVTEKHLTDLSEFEITVYEGPLYELLAGGHQHFILLIHEDLVEVAVLDLLPCRPVWYSRKDGSD